MAPITLLLTASTLSIAILIAQYVLAYFRSPLKTLPGPFLAQFTDLWRLWNHYTQTHIETQTQLHAKYGNIVRIGPNTVSVTDPDLIKTIYSTRGTFVKVSFPYTLTLWMCTHTNTSTQVGILLSKRRHPKQPPHLQHLRHTQQ
jgi:hypothetical protein